MTEDPIGRRLHGGEYEIREVLGRGGMATVYRAYSFPLGTDVAIKFLAPRLSQDAGFRERFHDEARSLAGLFHPNLVEVHTYGEEGDLVYIAMRLVPGGTLKDRLNLLGTPLDLTTTARLIGQVAEGLQHAHDRGLVHLDIKPANILLGRADWPLLADFGITRAIQHQQTEHGHERLAGTPAYMSPEQCQGGPVDGRSDQYSLAITAYELLTGRRPFEAQTTEDLLQRQIEAPPPRPRELNPGIPGPVEAVLLRGLAKDPNDRYPTVRTFGQALTEAVEQTRGMSLETKEALAAVTPNLIGVLGLILLAPFLLGSLPGVRLGNNPLPLSWPFQFVLALLVGLLLLRVRWHVVGLLTRAVEAVVGESGRRDPAAARTDTAVERLQKSLTGAVEGTVNLAYLFGGYRLLAVPLLDLARAVAPPLAAQALAGGLAALVVLLALGALIGIGRLAGPLVAMGVGVVAFGVFAALPSADLGLPADLHVGWSLGLILAAAGLIALIAARFPIHRLAEWLAQQVLLPLVIATRPSASAADLAAARRQLGGVAVAIGDLLLLLAADAVLRPPLVPALGALIGAVPAALAMSGLLGLLWLVLAARLRALGGSPGLALAALLGLPLLLTLPLLDPLVVGSALPETIAAWVLATAATLLLIVARRPLQTIGQAALGPVVERGLVGARPGLDRVEPKQREDAFERRVRACGGIVGGFLDVGLLVAAYWFLGLPLVSALAQATGQNWLGSIALGGLLLVASGILWWRIRAARASFADTGDEARAPRVGMAFAIALGLAMLVVAGCAAVPATLAAPAAERFGAIAEPLDHVLVNWQFWQPDTPKVGEATYNIALSCSNGDALGEFREAFQPAPGDPVPSGNVAPSDPRLDLAGMPCASWHGAYFDLRQAAGLAARPSLSWNWVDLQIVLGADGAADVVERHWVAFTEGSADHLEWVEPGDAQGVIQNLVIREGNVAYPLDPAGPPPDRYARIRRSGAQTTLDWYFPTVDAPVERTFTLQYRLPIAVEKIGDGWRFSRQVLLPRAGPSWRTTVSITLPDVADPAGARLTTSDAAASRRMLDGRIAWFESKDQPADGSLRVTVEHGGNQPSPTPRTAASTPTSTVIAAVVPTASPTETPTDTPTPAETATESTTATAETTESSTPSASATSGPVAPTSTPTVAVAPAVATQTPSATPVPATSTVTSSPSPTTGVCSGDEAMTFSPASPLVGQPFTVIVTASQNDQNVKLSGPDNPSGLTTRTNNGKFEWYWQVTPTTAGQRSYNFFAQTSTLCTTNVVTVQSPTATSTVKPTNTSTFTPTVKPTSTFTPIPANTPTFTVVPGAGNPNSTSTPRAIQVTPTPDPTSFYPNATPTPPPIG